MIGVKPVMFSFFTNDYPVKFAGIIVSTKSLLDLLGYNGGNTQYTEVKRHFYRGKVAHGPANIKQDDEDEGSPPRGGARRIC